jgi:uncharacterized protein (UPF0371 family)
MNQAKITLEDRKVVGAANNKMEETSDDAVAMELLDGTIVTGKTSDLLGPSAAVLLNAVKYLAEIGDDVHIIAPSAIEPIQRLKVEYLGSKNPRLHTDEVLIALSSSASADENAAKALNVLKNLRGAQAHSTVRLTKVDLDSFKKLGVQVTMDSKSSQSVLVDNH